MVRKKKNKKNQASPIYKFYVQSLKKKIFIFKNSHTYKRDFVYINDVCNVQEQMLKKTLVVYIILEQVKLKVLKKLLLKLQN